MKNFFKSSIFTSIVLFVLGLLLIFESEATITTISYIIGAILMAAGTFAFVRYIRNNKIGFETSELDVLYGIVTIVLGIIVVTNPHAIASIIPIVLGIAIIISSAIKIQYAFDLKNCDNDMWKTTMVIAIISTICGIVLLFNPFAGAVLIMRIVGIFILIYSVLDIISTLIIKKNVDEFKTIVEAEIIEETEDATSNDEIDEKESSKKTSKNKKQTPKKNKKSNSK